MLPKPMTNPDARARRAIIQLGNIEVEGFQLPDGSYRMSQSQTAEIVGKDESNARKFLSSKGVKALLGKAYTPGKIEVEPGDQIRGQTRINALPLAVVSAFWVWECSRGNKRALALVMAMTLETLERRFDAAFDVERSEAERNQRLTERLAQVEVQAADAFAEADIATSREKLLEQQLRDAGLEPWQLPSGDE